jgi:threonine dehydrogenase-like Zn-dependent dehydrogenase
MRAVVARKGKLVVDEIAAPTPAAGQILTRTLVCGICGSDLHALQHADHLARASDKAGVTGGLDPNADFVMGHEFCCEVLDANGSAFKAGQKVVALPVLPGPNGFVSLGYSNRIPGGYAEQLLLSAMLTIPVPNGLAPEIATLTEPLAVGEHAVVKAGLAGGEACLVLGCGPVGLAVIACLKARGHGPVIAADYSPQRRAAAEKMGADDVIDPGQGSPYAELAKHNVARSRMEAMFAQSQGRTMRPLVLFECVGVPGMIQAIADSAPQDVRVVIVGVCMEADKIEPLSFINKEIELRFVLGYAREEFAQALQRLADGETKYASIVTDVVSLDGAPEAFTRLQTDKTQIKILVAPGKA